MTSNTNTYGKSMRMLIQGISLFTGFGFTLLVFAYVDIIFFGGELSVHLRQHLGRFMMGLIMIPIFGGGAYIAYWATRSNARYMDAYSEKSEIQDNEIADPNATSSIEHKVKELAKNDPAFYQLLNRYYGYLKGISGSGKFGAKQVLDLYAHSGKSARLQITLNGLGILLFIITLALTVSHVENTYDAEFNALLHTARNARPHLALVVISAFACTLFLILFRSIRYLAEKVLVPLMNVTSSLISIERPDRWTPNYTSFLNERHSQVYFPWRAHFYPILAICSLLPLAIGILLQDFALGAAGGLGCLAGLLLMRFDSGRGDWFRFTSAETISLAFGSKKTILSIADIDEVVVHYQSIKDRSFRISSATALLRSFITRKVLDALFESPELIPSSIHIFTKQGQAYAIPLRYIERNSQAVHSHEIEFFFAYWLKSKGFQFELAESDEDAGDWRASAPGSKTD